MRIDFIRSGKAHLRSAVLSLLAVSGCGFVDYDAAPVGKFEGTLFVMWIENGGPLGDGKFVYVPNPRDPLRFIRGEAGSVQVIQPQMMYTDGGSIPKIAQAFEGFSPWGYAPAYMIHDWLFVARQCITDGKANPEELKIADMEFQESAEVIAEAIKTLIESNRVRGDDTSPRVISSTVAGPVSRYLWNRAGACNSPRVTEDDRLAAESGIPGSSEKGVELLRSMPDGRTVPLVTGQIVDVVQF